MTTAHTPLKKEKEHAIIANIRRDWIMYAVLLLALFALLYTWNEQLTIEADIRADYEEYIEQCRISGGGIQWNHTRKPAYSIPSADSYG